MGRLREWSGVVLGRRRLAGIIGVGVVLALVATMFGLDVNMGGGRDDGQRAMFTIGGGEGAIVICHVANAAPLADYVCDGVEDDAQFQAAMDALPVTGGQIYVLGGTYTFVATVARAIDNITIEGIGQGSLFQNDGVTPIFSVGAQSNWVFRNFRTDAGGITLAGGTGYTLENVSLGATYYAYRTAGDITGDEWDIPSGRTATCVVAAYNASATSKAQADYVCDQIDDHVEILAAIAALPAHGGRIALSPGDFHIRAPIVVNTNGVIISGEGKYTTRLILSSNSDCNMIEVERNAGATLTTGFRLEHVELVGNRANQASGHGIYVNYGAHITIEDVGIAGIKQDGIHLTAPGGSHSSTIVMHALTITDCEVNGIHLLNAGGVFLSDSALDANVALAINRDAGGAGTFWITNCHFEANGTPCVDVVDAAVAIRGCSFADRVDIRTNISCSIEGSTFGDPASYGLQLTRAGDTLTRHRVIGNSFTSDMGINLNNVRGNVVASNSFNTITGDIYFNGTSTSNNNFVYMVNGDLGAFTHYINDTANANMAFGLTINQGTADDEIFTLKSSDVGHGGTGLSEADTFFRVSKSEGTSGGVQFMCLKDSDGSPSMAILFDAILDENADTTKSTAGRSIVEYRISQVTATSFGNIVADGNIFGVRARVGGGFSTLVLVDEDGDLWLNGHLTVAAGTPSEYFMIVAEEDFGAMPGNTQRYGLRVILQADKTAAGYAGSVHGVNCRVQVHDGNTQNWTGAIGVRGYTAYVNTMPASAGTVTGMASFVCTAEIPNAATVTNLYGLHIATPIVAGAKLVNDYGIYIAAQNTGSALNYAIYTNAGQVRLGDDLIVVDSYIELDEMAAPGAGGADTVRIYAFEGGGALTDLCAVFQDGTVDVFAQEVTPLDAPILTYSSNTPLQLILKKPHPGLVQYVLVFPGGEEFVLREVQYHDADKIAANQGAEGPLPAGWEVTTVEERVQPRIDELNARIAEVEARITLLEGGMAQCDLLIDQNLDEIVLLGSAISDLEADLAVATSEEEMELIEEALDNKRTELEEAKEKIAEEQEVKEETLREVDELYDLLDELNAKLDAEMARLTK